MGDRATVQFKGAGGVYLHWDGSRVQELLEGAQPKMRRGDPSYACARFVQHVANYLDTVGHGQPLSVGVVHEDEGDGRTFNVDMDTGMVADEEGVVLFTLDPNGFWCG